MDQLRLLYIGVVLHTDRNCFMKIVRKVYNEHDAMNYKTNHVHNYCIVKKARQGR